MNRETKRMLQRQGALTEEGTPKRERRQPPVARPQERERDDRGRVRRIVDFFKEVRGELRKVAWPTRSETANYSFIVLVAVVVLTSLIAALDYAFGNFVLTLFNE